ARAFAWVRARIADYGGCPINLFVAGHSAGGHPPALFASDETYLQAEGVRATDIKGVIAISGVYRIPPGDLDVTLGGASPLAFRFGEILPLRCGGGGWAPLAAVPGIPLHLNVFGPAFGDDPDVRKSASPITHVRPGLPPFLILC